VKVDAGAETCLSSHWRRNEAQESGSLLRYGEKIKTFDESGSLCKGPNPVSRTGLTGRSEHDNLAFEL
jgi:hypothetical protein